MWPFGSASGRQVDEMASLLAQEMTKLRPLQGKGAAGPGVSLKNLERKVDELFEKAVAFRKEHKLGVYKKARLANSFRWEMKELGYDPDFVEAATEKLVVAISRKD
jgi:hypothetical protein